MAHRREHPVVAEWVDDHCHAGVVLGGGPHHRRAADVDLFDAFVDAGAGVDGFGERIQVDDDELEGGDAELLERRGVFGFAQIRQQSGVHARVQCLDPAVEHFGKPVSSSTRVTGMPFSAMTFAVEPVETISMPASVSPGRARPDRSCRTR